MIFALSSSIPALLNIVLLIDLTLFTVPSSKALLYPCFNSYPYGCLVGFYVVCESDKAVACQFFRLFDPFVQSHFRYFDITSFGWNQSLRRTGSLPGATKSDEEPISI